MIKGEEVARGLSVINLKITIPLSTDNLDARDVEQLKARTTNLVIGQLRKQRIYYRTVKVEASVDTVSIKESNGLTND